ncbi:MAG: hypothetical protein LBB89_05215 [Treponema sp.]|nr:hypothetical protein [Treponema sp.]
MKTRKISLVLAVALAFALALGACDNESDPPENKPTTVTVTKDVTASFPVFSVATSVNFTASYSPSVAGDGFEANDVTYTVYCAELNRTYNNGTGFTANISDGYTDGVYTFTQTFKASDGTTINSRDIKILIDFGYFTQLQDANGTPLVYQSISFMPLHLSKSVTEVN